MKTKKRVLGFVPMTIIVFLTNYHPSTREDKKEKQLLSSAKYNIITLN